MPRRTPSRKLIPRTRTRHSGHRAEAKYEAGTSIRALAEETGRSYSSVHRILAEAGVTFRSRGGATRQKTALPS